MQMMEASPKIQLVETNDEHLVARIVRGDQQAFAALYRRHARYVAGVVYGLTGRTDEVEDIVQEVFATVARHVAGLREPAYFRTWTVKIAVRAARRRLAKGRAWFRVFGSEPEEKDLVVRAPDAGASLDLTRALGRIPPRLLEPWVLRRIEDRPLDEIAAVCDLSLATVKRHIAEVDRRLKRDLDEV